MGKKAPKNIFDDNPFVDDFLGWMESDEGQEAIEALDLVWALLDSADLDAKKRQIIWDDGQRLSFAQSVERIHATYPELRLDLIEERLIGWIEQGFAPETYTEEQLDELDRLTEKWVDELEHPPKTPKKRSRTRDS
jgi:hypothetical protein